MFLRSAYPVSLILSPRNTNPDAVLTRQPWRFPFQPHASESLCRSQRKERDVPTWARQVFCPLEPLKPLRGRRIAGREGSSTALRFQGGGGGAVNASMYILIYIYIYIYIYILIYIYIYIYIYRESFVYLQYAVLHLARQPPYCPSSTPVKYQITQQPTRWHVLSWPRR